MELVVRNFIEFTDNIHCPASVKLSLQRIVTNSLESAYLSHRWSVKTMGQLLAFLANSSCSKTYTKMKVCKSPNYEKYLQKNEKKN